MLDEVAAGNVGVLQSVPGGTLVEVALFLHACDATLEVGDDPHRHAASARQEKVRTAPDDNAGALGEGHEYDPHEPGEVLVLTQEVGLDQRNDRLTEPRQRVLVEKGEHLALEPELLGDELEHLAVEHAPAECRADPARNLAAASTSLARDCDVRTNLRTGVRVFPRQLIDAALDLVPMDMSIGQMVLDFPRPGVSAAHSDLLFALTTNLGSDRRTGNPRPTVAYHAAVMSVCLWVHDGERFRKTKRVAASLDELSLELPEGAYTTMRTYGGARVVGLSDHLVRLVETLTLLDSGRQVDVAKLRRAIARVIAVEARPDVRVRVTIPLAGDEMLLASEPWLRYPEELYEDGARCLTTPLDREQPLAKSTAFIRPSRTVKNSLDTGIHELIRVDRNGCLLEGITSNFLAVADGVLRTANSGVLAGVTRGVVLKLARALLPLVLEPIGVSDLTRVSEAFITSSTREVVPVVEIDGVCIGDGRPGPVSRTLLAAYRRHLEEISEVP